MRGTAHRWLFAILGIGLLAGGCSSVGDFCHSDDDCGSGLLCTATGGSRGVCTYPQGTQDLALKDQKLPDQNLPDTGGEEMALPDSRPDVKPDAAAVDQGAPDAATPDAATPDAAKPDAAKPDVGKNE